MLSRVGYFGGSNALWRTDVLKQYSFDPAMHCEDVDLSARVLLDGHRVLLALTLTLTLTLTLALTLALTLTLTLTLTR